MYKALTAALMNINSYGHGAVSEKLVDFFDAEMETQFVRNFGKTLLMTIVPYCSRPESY